MIDDLHESLADVLKSEYIFKNFDCKMEENIDLPISQCSFFIQRMPLLLDEKKKIQSIEGGFGIFIKMKNNMILPTPSKM